jgi:hypothetical protein
MLANKRTRGDWTAASMGGELQHRAAAAMAAGGSGWRAEGDGAVL